MKVATWNLERPKSNSFRNLKIIEILEELDADILIITENNDAINLGGKYFHFHTDELPKPYYSSGERRSSIYSKYQFIRSYQTYRSDTSLCLEFESEIGNLLVYATVVGIHGNRRPEYLTELELQMNDLERLSNLNKAIFYAGDLNMSFSDNYYYTKLGRQTFLNAFRDFDLLNTTADIPQNIDHIVLSVI